MFNGLERASKPLQKRFSFSFKKNLKKTVWVPVTVRSREKGFSFRFGSLCQKLRGFKNG